MNLTEMVNDLVIEFETQNKELPITKYPCLGTTYFHGHIEGLEEQAGVTKLRNFIPSMAFKLEEGALAFWFDPKDGLNTVMVLEKKLLAMKGDKRLSGVENYLLIELRNLSGLLQNAIELNVRFRLDPKPCDNPPPEIKQWLSDTYASFASYMQETLDTIRNDNNREMS